jgi:hypothetical protein
MAFLCRRPDSNRGPFITRAIPELRPVRLRGFLFVGVSLGGIRNAESGTRFGTRFRRWGVPPLRTGSAMLGANVDRPTSSSRLLATAPVEARGTLAVSLGKASDRPQRIRLPPRRPSRHEISSEAGYCSQGKRSGWVLLSAQSRTVADALRSLFCSTKRERCSPARKLADTGLRLACLDAVDRSDVRGNLASRHPGRATSP